jgi:hypothetical protein
MAPKKKKIIPLDCWTGDDGVVEVKKRGGSR